MMKPFELCSMFGVFILHFSVSFPVAGSVIQLPAYRPSLLRQQDGTFQQQPVTGTGDVVINMDTGNDVQVAYVAGSIKGSKLGSLKGSKLGSIRSGRAPSKNGSLHGMPIIDSTTPPQNSPPHNKDTTAIMASSPPQPDTTLILPPSPPQTGQSPAALSPNNNNSAVPNGNVPSGPGDPKTPETGTLPPGGAAPTDIAKSGGPVAPKSNAKLASLIEDLDWWSKYYVSKEDFRKVRRHICKRMLFKPKV